MSRAEIDATINLLKNMPATVVDMISRMASKWGMTKGPWSHLVLASVVLRIGYVMLQLEGTEYEAALANTEEVLELLVERTHTDFEKLHPQFRKNISLDQLQLKQRITSWFVYLMSLLQRQVPGELFEAEKQDLVDAFMRGGMDDDIELIHTKIPMPPADTLMCVREFRNIIKRIETATDKNVQLRKEEAARKIQARYWP